MNDMRLRARGGNFALLLKLTFGQLRPKAPPLDFASWAQLDQLMSAASPPKNSHDSALNQNLPHNFIQIYTKNRICTFYRERCFLYFKGMNNPPRF
ncbi:MAG: hypothetical protein HDT21_10775 [Ruminococcus sp.]|nr:hypothetical protein [Ruminococcus sp.]